MKHLKLLYASVILISSFLLSGCRSDKGGNNQPSKVTVSFVNEGSQTSYEVNRNSRIARPQDPTKSGSVFVGWFTSQDATEPFDFQTTEVTGDLTLYARFNAAGSIRVEKNPAHIPDVLQSVDDVNKKLGYSADQYFAQRWEDRKVTGTAPIESLITKQDYDVLFPFDFQKSQIPGLHDQNHTYYTWENLVAASRYFPNFLNEGTKEDKYRELAAFLGNKSHETGDGWVAQGEDRYKMGLVWIVELSALGRAARNINNQEDLYEGWLRDSYLLGNSLYAAVDGKSYHGRGPVQLSHPINYGQMSQAMFGDASILLENPDLIARNGIYGWASAIWFWMQPQGNKPSCHDTMVGNVDLSEPYTAPTSIGGGGGTPRTHTANSKGTDAAGNAVDYSQFTVPAGMEVGFGMTINIINGALESNTLDNRQARRIAFYARFLDYFGTAKGGRNDGKNEPISPQVGGMGGDPVPQETVELFKDWRNWIDLNGNGLDASKNFPIAKIPNVVSSRYTLSF